MGRESGLWFMLRDALIAVRAAIILKPGILGGGKEISEDDLVSLISDTRLLNGVTFSGGEPISQAKEFASLAKRVKSLGLDIVTYTGYTFEELLEMSIKDIHIKRLLENTDLLVDGPYLASERDLSVPFRGSRNQRLIDVVKWKSENRMSDTD
jgi:anaerobic ribonucleoside-triphosphate reductase activating protein